MNPALLPAISAFACIARHGSFTRAAEILGVSPSALSQTLRALESSLGVRLLDRSTRKVATTEIGRQFLLDAEPALANLNKAVERLDEVRSRPAGALRLNLSQTAADIIVMPHLAAFLEAYPDITLELVCDNAFVDLVAGGFDAGIRLGENLAQDVVAVALGGPHRIATVAAPSYLAGRTPPGAPKDLSAHRCLNIRLPNGLYRWEYTRRDRTVTVEPPSSLLCNDGELLLQAIRAGAGIGCAFETQVARDLERGALVPLLEPWWPAFPGFFLYYPSRLHVARKLRAFIDFMQARTGVSDRAARSGTVAPTRTRASSSRPARPR